MPTARATVEPVAAVSAQPSSAREDRAALFDEVVASPPSPPSGPSGVPVEVNELASAALGEIESMVTRRLLPRPSPMVESPVLPEHRIPPEPAPIPRRSQPGMATDAARRGPDHEIVSAAPAHRPSRRSRRGVALVVLAAVVLGALGFVTFGPGGRRAEAASYRRTFTPGETHAYRFSMEMTGSIAVFDGQQPLDMAMQMDVLERTERVRPDGTAIIVQRIEDLRLSVNGADLPAAEQPLEVRTTVRADGTIESVDGLDGLTLGETGPATELFGPGAMGPLLPAEAVAPGDSWTVRTAIPHPLSTDRIQATARNRLVSRRHAEGVSLAVIRSELRVPLDVRIDFARLLQAAEQTNGESLEGQVPLGAVLRYHGDVSASLVQTIDAATGRPVQVAGTGAADVTVSIEETGRFRLPDVRMSLRTSMTMDAVPPDAPNTTDA